ncbi:MAG: hypothetical protein IIU14_00565 [Ruminococcus sp.]|nr:hypothetical protein [Ruminococcus sp.]
MSKVTKQIKPKLTPVKVIRRLVLIAASICFVCALVYVINRFVNICQLNQTITGFCINHTPDKATVYHIIYY